MATNELLLICDSHHPCHSYGLTRIFVGEIPKADSNNVQRSAYGQSGNRNVCSFLCAVSSLSRTHKM